MKHRADLDRLIDEGYFQINTLQPLEAEDHKQRIIDLSKQTDGKFVDLLEVLSKSHRNFQYKTDYANYGFVYRHPGDSLVKKCGIVVPDYLHPHFKPKQSELLFSGFLGGTLTPGTDGFFDEYSLSNSSASNQVVKNQRIEWFDEKWAEDSFDQTERRYVRVAFFIDSQFQIFKEKVDQAIEGFGRDAKFEVDRWERVCGYTYLEEPSKDTRPYSQWGLSYTLESDEKRALKKIKFDFSGKSC